MAKSAKRQNSRAATVEPWKSRIVGEVDVDPRTLTPHPENYRTHPARQQSALAAVLEDVGCVQRVIVNRASGRILDGHLRVELAVEQGRPTIPVEYVDVTEDEERAILVSFDPISALAEADKDRRKALLAGLSERRADLLREVGLISKGFRKGQGHLSQGIPDWKDDASFFAIPEWLAPIHAEATDLVVQFSGGKDSTAAVLWAAHNRGEKRLTLAFVDPGVEFPCISAHIREVAKFFDCEYVILKPKLDWWTWIADAGKWPSMLFRPCAIELIHKTFAGFVKSQCEPGKAILLTGSRAEEAGRGSKKTERSPLESLGAAAEKYQHFAPCFAAKKDLEAQIISDSGVPLWEGYERGFVRTACWCCPGQCGLQAAALNREYPGLANDIRRWEKRLGPFRPTSQPPVSFDDVVRAGERKLEHGETSTADAEID